MDKTLQNQGILDMSGGEVLQRMVEKLPAVCLAKMNTDNKKLGKALCSASNF